MTKQLQQIMEIGKELRLPIIQKEAKEFIDEANKNNISYEDFLANILQKESDARREISCQNRIRTAAFPFKKYLEDLSITDLPLGAQKKLQILTTLDFIKEGRNIILSGNPGTGKTHLAIGLGMKACLKRYKVWFVTIPLLINMLKECRSEQRLRVFQNRFEKYDLVIADELGYISFDKEGAELLFTHLSLRSGKKSTIITSNLSFERWEEIFQDPVMTAAIIDRLTHNSYILNMSGNSYRMKETRNWLESKQLV